MAPKKLTYFDVRRRQRHDQTGKRQEIPREMSINLMCFLLRGIDYGKLYDEPIVPTGRRHLFDDLIRNASELPPDLLVDADGNSYPNLISEFTKPDGSGAFDEIKVLIDQYNQSDNADRKNNIFLGELFWKTPAQETYAPLRAVKEGIANALHKITDGKPAMRHFCAPFVPIYRGEADLVGEADFREFVNCFRNRNIEYFYTTGGTPAERPVAKKARTVGILMEKKTSPPPPPPNQQVSILTKGDGNSKHCSNGRCTDCTNLDHWCEEVLYNGNWTCALGSDSE